MLEGWFVNNVLMHKEIRPYPPQPQETSGVVHGTDSIYRYSLKESEYPTLIIVDPIEDGRGDIIPPGHYELALSDEWDFFILLQSKKPVALIPVVKVEEDESEKDRLADPQNKKRIKKEEKQRKKINEKRAKVGMPPDKEDIFMEASIEYVEDGHYYRIKYVRGTIKAWGVIKR